MLQNRYSGEFQWGVREGFGQFYYSDGSTYEGQWKGNKKHGYAIFTNDQGLSSFGYYEDGRLKRNLSIFKVVFD